ncbi:MAG: Spy/CpxP family protein refolding chaperone [Rhodocyclaceae bacterium]|nr:Spy/CpxP family protein refolding chaperone [Rhodocyclaceae bacterium]
MKLSDHQFTNASLRLIAAAALATTLAFAPAVVFAADKDAHEDRAELRIKHMHAMLKITPTQEEQWAKVAETMRDNAKTMDGLTQARADHAKEMTAVDDLKSYGEIAEAHADGLRKLTPAFASLYAGMSDAQKLEADSVFRRGDSARKNHKHGNAPTNK